MPSIDSSRPTRPPPQSDNGGSNPTNPTPVVEKASGATSGNSALAATPDGGKPNLSNNNPGKQGTNLASQAQVPTTTTAGGALNASGSATGTPDGVVSPGTAGWSQADSLGRTALGTTDFQSNRGLDSNKNTMLPDSEPQGLDSGLDKASTEALQRAVGRAAAQRQPDGPDVRTIDDKEFLRRLERLTAAVEDDAQQRPANDFKNDNNNNNNNSNPQNAPRSDGRTDPRAAPAGALAAQAAGGEGATVLPPGFAALEAALLKELQGALAKEMVLRGQAAKLPLIETDMGRGAAATLAGTASDGAGTGAGQGLGGLFGNMLEGGKGMSTGRGEAMAGTMADPTTTNAVQARLTNFVITNMPPMGIPQPVLAMIAADMFRLQSARMELLASSRAVDEDGEMPPIDEDEAAMKRRQVQGVDLGSMLRWDLAPKVKGEGEDEEAEPPNLALRAALMTGALQQPQRVMPMFFVSDDSQALRLFARQGDGSFTAQWVQAKNTEADPLAAFSMGSMASLSPWMDFAEKAWETMHGLYEPAGDVDKNIKIARLALETVFGEEVSVHRVGVSGAKIAPPRAIYQALCSTNPPRSNPMLAVTGEETHADDGLLPGHTYGVVGLFVKDDKAQVMLLESPSDDPNSPVYRLFSVSYPVFYRNVAAIVALRPRRPSKV